MFDLPSPNPLSIPKTADELSAAALRISQFPSLDTLEALNHPTQGKDRRSAVNRLVRGFREEFKFNESDLNPWGGEQYRAIVNRFKDELTKFLPNEVVDRINAFASPEHYREIRGAYRMRAITPVSDEELVSLTHEIKAALVWRELRTGFGCGDSD